MSVYKTVFSADMTSLSDNTLNRVACLVIVTWDKTMSCVSCQPYCAVHAGHERACEMNRMYKCIFACKY